MYLTQLGKLSGSLNRAITFICPQKNTKAEK